MPKTKETHDGEYIITYTRDGVIYLDKEGKRFQKDIEGVGKALLYLESCGYSTVQLDVFQLKYISFDPPVISITKNGKVLDKRK